MTYKDPNYKHNYYLKNKLKIDIKCKKWALLNPDKIKEKGKKYRINNKNKIITANHLHYIKNKKSILKRHLNYLNHKRKTNIHFRLYDNLRSRIHDALKYNHKSARTTELIGCSINELHKHLEKQFIAGMNWKNYGKWHVDHIVPCASFNLSNKEDQYKCFHYTNLQPMWALDNIKKGKNITNVYKPFAAQSI